LSDAGSRYPFISCDKVSDHTTRRFDPAHVDRNIVHFNVTEHPTAQWTDQQIVEACPWDTAPRYLLRDRDSIYSVAFHGSKI
jgi:hypothetical protein